MIDVDQKVLENTIQPMGIHTIKAKYIIQMCQRLLAVYDGVVPKDFCEIRKFVGIGWKIGLVTLYEGYQINAGIAVDTHLLKIFKTLG